MTVSLLPYYAERVDLARNMARFYALDVSIDLFGRVRLERRWGRIGSRGQGKVELLKEGDAISIRIDALVRQKTRRGYRRKESPLESAELLP